VTSLAVFFILLVPFAAAGLALINTGLCRSRSAAHSMLASLCAVAVAAIVYVVIGFAWQGFAGRPSHAVTIGGKAWSWIASEPFFLRGMALDGHDRVRQRAADEISRDADADAE
jgi:Amt family ammonium transporter